MDMNETVYRRVPDKATLQDYLSRGLTQQQIVAEWERETNVRVSRSAIGMAIARYELVSANPRPRYDDMLPWEIRTEHSTHYFAKMLRLEARRRRGETLNEEQLGRLDSWLRTVDEKDAVIYYDPETIEGFWLLQREPDDEDIVRPDTKPPSQRRKPK